jgi:hypothetical protein
MPYLLDGNNLIGRPDPTEQERHALVLEIADRLRNTRARAVLFFDGGARRSSSLGALQVRDGFGSSADDDILAAIAGSSSTREMTVVTSDQALGRRARDAGAAVLRPEDFWARFGKRRAGSEKENGDVDVEEWARYFADERNREK